MLSPGSPVRLISRPRRKFSNVLVSFLVILTLLWFLSFQRSNITAQPVAREDAQDPLDPIKNDTLGFEKIFVINSPQRPDRRDAIVLGSSATGFHVDFIDKIIHEEDSIQGEGPTTDRDEIAAFRSHLNAVQRVVADRLASALIFEDDVDWDVNLKTQLRGFAQGALKIHKSNASHSPYGDSWDLLWLGHCGVKCNSSSPVQVMPHDITAISSRFLPPYLYDAPAGTGNNVRMTCKMEEAACSGAYAISYRASQKILATLTLSTDNQAVNIEGLLSQLCRDGSLECYSSYPSLVGRWNWTRHGLDPSHSTQGPDSQASLSMGAMYSTLQNVGRMLGGESQVRATVDDALVPELNPDLFEVPYAVLKWTDNKGGHERHI
ncbi:glycosyltransferase family 25 protein [Aspergillus carbonarius ITEM 5010]|uniref:Glycosyltransferase family 25 protein n=1 Tax=Aspergillus carbonarius (strain ITEM 5010) TaxID=602072 RepID=A0A1R3RJ52_ASPC5|nr:glycosyltransferase family 25 protein [Aspergillus carbonarius ITEM 5010]